MVLSPLYPPQVSDCCSPAVTGICRCPHLPAWPLSTGVLVGNVVWRRPTHPAMDGLHHTSSHKIFRIVDILEMWQLHEVYVCCLINLFPAGDIHVKGMSWWCEHGPGLSWVWWRRRFWGIYWCENLIGISCYRWHRQSVSHVTLKPPFVGLLQL